MSELPTDWFPSRYGPDDTVGAANNLSADIVRDTVKRLTKGKVYSLAIDTGPRTPRRGMEDYKVYIFPNQTPSGKPRGSNQVTGFVDFVTAWQGCGTNMDGLGHAGINFHFYNGIPADEIYGMDGVKKLSIHAVPPIVTRGVVLDMAAYYGTDIVKEGSVFNRKEIEGAAERQAIEIRKGDVVLLHTGRLSYLHSDPERLMASWPGVGKEGARYLASKGIVAVGSDNHTVETNPCEVKGEHAVGHQIFLAQNGVYILEFVDTRALVADGVTEFLFVLGQPRLVGAVQAIVNPIAIT